MSDYSNFLQDIEKVLKDEEVVALAWGMERGQDFYYRSNNKPYYSDDWESVKFLFDYEYSTGYGGADCHALLMWTPTRIIFIEEYDGATGVGSLPRNPEKWDKNDVRFI